MKNQKNYQRKSNIEFLRVVAMFMIVALHIVCYCILGQLSWGDRTFS